MSEEWLRDPQMLRDVLLRRTLRATISAAGVLSRAARGEKFRSDEQRWACLGLIRLAGALMRLKPEHLESQVHSLTHPSITPEEEEELNRILDKDYIEHPPPLIHGDCRRLDPLDPRRSRPSHDHDELTRSLDNFQGATDANE